MFNFNIYLCVILFIGKRLSTNHTDSHRRKGAHSTYGRHAFSYTWYVLLITLTVRVSGMRTIRLLEPIISRNLHRL